MWKWFVLGAVILYLVTRSRAAPAVAAGGSSGRGTPVGTSQSGSALPDTVGEPPRTAPRPTLTDPVPYQAGFYSGSELFKPTASYKGK